MFTNIYVQNNDLLAILEMWYSSQEFIFRPFWSHFCGFTPSVSLEIPPPFYSYRKPFQGLSACLLKVEVTISNCSGVMLICFLSVFRIKRIGRSLGQEKKSGFLEIWLTHISIKIAAMLHAGMLYTMLEWKLKFWILAWSKSIESSFLK